MRERPTNRSHDLEVPSWLYWLPFGAVWALILWALVIMDVGQEEFATGTFGDAFAPFAAVANVAALVAALISVALQRNELRLTREELRLARIEAQKQREAQEQHVETAKRQQRLKILELRLDYWDRVLTLSGLEQGAQLGFMNHDVSKATRRHLSHIWTELVEGEEEYQAAREATRVRPRHE